MAAEHVGGEKLATLQRQCIRSFLPHNPGIPSEEEHKSFQQAPDLALCEFWLNPNVKTTLKEK